MSIGFITRNPIVRQLTIWPRGGKQGAETLHPCNIPAFLDGSKPLQSITATNARGRQPAPSGAQQPVSAHHRNTSHNQLAHNYIPRHTRIHLAHTHTPAHSRIRLAGTRTPARNHIRSHTHTRVRLLANPLLALASVLDRKSTRMNSSHLGISYA